MGYPPETSAGSSENFYFKLLCPQFVTGLIIGRGGSVINQLNSTCGAKIKLSQNNEFFPTTTDRVIVCKYFSLFFLFFLCICSFSVWEQGWIDECGQRTCIKNC